MAPWLARGRDGAGAIPVAGVRRDRGRRDAVSV